MVPDIVNKFTGGGKSDEIDISDLSGAEKTEE
jgi:hypothetical protein